MSTSTPDNNNGDAVVTMVPCDDCGHLVPEANLAIHHATACGARARRPTDDDSSLEESNLGLRQRRPWSTPTRSTRPPPSVERVNNDATATAATDDDDDTSNAMQQDNTTRDNDSSKGAPKKDNEPESPGVLEVNDMVDLTSDETPSNTPQGQQWACPRCTLLNPNSEQNCNACQYHNPDIVRPADATRRERLVPDFDTPPPSLRRSNSSPSNLPAGATSGALLGSFLGAANAYMGGRSVGSGALEGAMTGFMGGALVGELMNNMPTETSGTTSVASARSDAAMGLPPYPSMTPTSSNSRRTMQPRQSVRVVRHRQNGRYVTTVYTSGGATTTTTTGGTADPLLNLMVQSLLSNGQGRTGIDNMSYEELLRAFGDGTENMGADEGTIENLPTAVLENPPKELPADQMQCSICLEDFKAQETRKTLPCLHGFHKDCVDKWLRTNGSCPVCKHKVSS